MLSLPTSTGAPALYCLHSVESYSSSLAHRTCCTYYYPHYYHYHLLPSDFAQPRVVPVPRSTSDPLALLPTGTCLCTVVDLFSTHPTCVTSTTTTILNYSTTTVYSYYYIVPYCSDRVLLLALKEVTLLYTLFHLCLEYQQSSVGGLVLCSVGHLSTSTGRVFYYFYLTLSSTLGRSTSCT